MAGQQRRGINWTGIAAFITAVSGLVALLINQQNAQQKQTMTSQSMYSVLEYRISVLEKKCEVTIPEKPIRRPRLHARIELKKAIPKKPKMRAVPASFQAIQRYVESAGRPWQLRDGSSDDGSSDHP